MRKYICLLLCVVLILSISSLSACSDDKSEKNTTTVQPTTVISLESVKSYVTQGKIDTVEFALGTKAGFILDKYNTTAPATTNASDSDEDVPVFYTNNNKEDYFSIMQGASQYFYLKDDDSKQISVIACTSDAFNFKTGIDYSQSVIDSLGKPDVTDVPAKQDLIYTFGGAHNPSRLTYNFGKYRLDFVFTDDVLLATVLTDTELYPYMGHNVEPTTATTVATTSAESEQ